MYTFFGLTHAYLFFTHIVDRNRVTMTHTLSTLDPTLTIVVLVPPPLLEVIQVLGLIGIPK